MAFAKNTLTQEEKDRIIEQALSHMDYVPSAPDKKPKQKQRIGPKLYKCRNCGCIYSKMTTHAMRGYCSRLCFYKKLDDLKFVPDRLYSNIFRDQCSFLRNHEALGYIFVNEAG